MYSPARSELELELGLGQRQIQKKPKFTLLELKGVIQLFNFDNDDDNDDYNDARIPDKVPPDRKIPFRSGQISGGDPTDLWRWLDIEHRKLFTYILLQ